MGKDTTQFHQRVVHPYPLNKAGTTKHNRSFSGPVATATKTGPTSSQAPPEASAAMHNAVKRSAANDDNNNDDELSPGKQPESNNQKNNQGSEFLPPPAKKTTRARRGRKETTKVSTHNKYAPLAGDPMEVKESEEEQQKKPRRIPPIVVHNINQNHDTSTKKIQEICKEDIQVKFLKSGALKVFFSCMEDYTKMLTYLQAHGREYYTHTPNWEKTKKIVVKGLPKMSDEDITEDLWKHKIICTKVGIIKKKGAPMPDLPVRVLDIKHDTNLSVVYKIKTICNTKVSWEPYRNKKGVSQCHRCQRFGHGSANCRLTPVCVKCGEDHLTKDCEKLPEAPPTCANCNGDHPASYTGCPELQKYKDRKAEKPLPKKQGKQQFSSYEKDFPALRQKNPEVAQATAINSSQPPPAQNAWTGEKRKPNNVDELSFEQLSRLLQAMEKLRSLCNLEQIIQKLETLTANLSSCKTDQERLFAFIAHGCK